MTIQCKHDFHFECNEPFKIHLTKDVKDNCLIPLNVKWSDLIDVKCLTKGGTSLIYTALFNKIPVIIKTINPDKLDDFASYSLENELEILQKLNHPNIVQLYGAGYTPDGRRFLILEKLEGGTLDFIFKPRFPLQKSKCLPIKYALMYAISIADALAYCHSVEANTMILHRDLKPDNIGFTKDGKLKIIDFGLACVIEDASPYSDEVFEMSGGTGSLRYMAPEVANMSPYNHKADVYSFGIILWELLSCKKPYVGLTADAFYEKIVYGGIRPPINKKWPDELIQIMEQCWSPNSRIRPTFETIKMKLEMFIMEKFNISKDEVHNFNKRCDIRRDSTSSEHIYNRSKKNVMNRRMSASA